MSSSAHSDESPLVNEDSDESPLVNEENHHALSLRGFCGFWSRRICASIIFSLFVIVGITLAVYFSYYKTNNNMNIELKVMAFHTWGVPATLGSLYKTQRMAAIAKEVSKAEYDIYFLGELWMEPDHTVISNNIPMGYHITGFRQLSLASCDGRVLPSFCSGLAIVSKYPFLEVHFDSYTYHGNFLKVGIDGEYFARKGVGRVRIEPSPNLTVDLFVTRTAADPDPIHGYSNYYYRIRQIWELVNFLQHSNAEVVILGGGLNDIPDMTPNSVYQLVRQEMKNCIEEKYDSGQWMDPKFATYGNKNNTFSNNLAPLLHDYIFYRANHHLTDVWTISYYMPFFKTSLDTKNALAEHGKLISLSNHEAITSTIGISFGASVVSTQ